MEKPEDPFESALFDVAHALIDGLPDSWHAAHMRVQVMTHGDEQGMGYMIANPDVVGERMQPTEELSAAVNTLYAVSQESGDPWRELSLRVKSDDDGNWDTNTRFDPSDEEEGQSE